MSGSTFTLPDPVAPVAEQWLLASDDGVRLFAMRTALAVSPSPLTAWRVRHRRVALLPCAALPAAIASAVEEGSTLVHVYADLSHAGCVRRMLQR